MTSYNIFFTQNGNEKGFWSVSNLRTVADSGVDDERGTPTVASDAHPSYALVKCSFITHQYGKRITLFMHFILNSQLFAH